MEGKRRILHELASRSVDNICTRNLPLFQLLEPSFFIIAIGITLEIAKCLIEGYHNCIDICIFSVEDGARRGGVGFFSCHTSGRRSFWTWDWSGDFNSLFLFFELIFMGVGY